MTLIPQVTDLLRTSNISSAWLQVTVHELFLIPNIPRYLRQSRYIPKSGKHEHSLPIAFRGSRDVSHFFLREKDHHTSHKECLLPAVNRTASVVYLSSIAFTTSHLQDDILQSSQVNANDYIFSRLLTNLKDSSVQKKQMGKNEEERNSLNIESVLFQDYSKWNLAGFKFCLTNRKRQY